jgi:hypothetical protein
VNWQSKRGGRQGDGEADFVLLNASSGVTVLEVKGGQVTLEEGWWYSTDRNGQRNPIKNPYEQAVASKHALIDYLRQAGLPMQRIPVNYAVVFPDITLRAPLGPAGPREISRDANDLRDIRAASRRTAAHWGASCRMTTAELRRIIELLAPTVVVRRRLAEDIADAEELLIELTDTQIWVFSQLKSVRNALILGAAGTGKTVLAIERARRLAADGLSVLLVCYNELLGKRLGEELADERRVRACTFHALCLGEAAQARLPIPAERDERWWEEGAPELLIEAAALEGTTFDAIIVDEGQDFCQLWFESLRLLAQGAQDAPFYVFADWHQQLYRRSWEAPADWTRLELDINCRSTLPIAARVAGIFGEAPASKGAEGPAPRFYEIDVAREGIRFVQRFVSRLLLEEGLAPKQICVLTDDAGVVARLRELLAGDKPFVPMGGHGVVIETVARFKGLEAEAIVLMLTDGLQDGLEGRAALYTAMSRAQSALFVISSPRVKRLARWT